MSAAVGRTVPRRWNIPLGIVYGSSTYALHHAVLGGCRDGHLLDVPNESLNSLSRHTPCIRSEPRLSRWIPWCSSDADDDEGSPDAGEFPAEAVYGVGVG